jgi:hypothetical protein
MTLPKQLEKYKELGKGLLHSVREIIFSAGTYQVQVYDSQDKKNHWVFLQCDDEKNLLDYFCDCPLSEQEQGCAHIVAAYYAIDGRQPVHVRFARSFYKALFQMAAQRLGYDVTSIQQQQDGSYVALSHQNTRLFYMKPKAVQAQQKMREYIVSRVSETEETSLKFSNLSMEEIEQYRQGRGSAFLLYELSFWSDIAKWLFLLSERIEVQITFHPIESLPSFVQIECQEVFIECHIPQASWPELIDYLSSVNANLQVIDASEQTIRDITYDEIEQCFFITHHQPKDALLCDAQQNTKIGKYFFIPFVGFMKTCDVSWMADTKIFSTQIAQVLSEDPSLVKKYLLGTDIHEQPIPMKYKLFFQDQDLHIQCYLFQEKDLDQTGAAFFPPWAYIPNQGFYCVSEALFPRCGNGDQKRKYF